MRGSLLQIAEQHIRRCIAVRQGDAEITNSVGNNEYSQAVTLCSIKEGVGMALYLLEMVFSAQDAVGDSLFRTAVAFAGFGADFVAERCPPSPRGFFPLDLCPICFAPLLGGDLLRRGNDIAEKCLVPGSNRVKQFRLIAEVFPDAACGCIICALVETVFDVVVIEAF